jgi:hypothetical protein
MKRYLFLILLSIHSSNEDQKETKHQDDQENHDNHDEKFKFQLNDDLDEIEQFHRT